MISIKLFFSCASFILILHRIYGLEKLPLVKENDISMTSDTIEIPSEDVLDVLQLKKVKDKPWFEQYATIQNHLLAVTKQDYDNLNQIAQLVEFGNKRLDNVTEHYVTLINEVLDEDPEPRHNDSEIINYIDNILDKLKDLRKLNKDIDVDIELLEEFDLDSNENKIPRSYNDSMPEELGLWREISNSRRIYKGDRTKIKHYPFMAGIQIFDAFQCAGSIISSDLILTAASCVQLAYNNRFFRENPIFLSVHVGSSFYQGGGEVIPVMELYFHPSYVPKTLLNNICVLRLQRHLNFKKGKVMRIDIDRKPSSLPINVHGILVLGWGAKSLANGLANPWENILSSAVLDYYPLSECGDIYGKEWVTRQHFCAGFMSKGGGACNHDVGGPGIVDGILTGIISFGSPQCGAVDAPTVFVKVGFYAEWIDMIIKQSKDIPKIRMKTTVKMETVNTPAPYAATYPTTIKITPLLPTTTAKQVLMEEDTVEETGLRINEPKSIEDIVEASSRSDEAKEFEELLESNSLVKNFLKHISGADDPKKIISSLKKVARKEKKKPIVRDKTLKDPTAEKPITTEVFEQETEQSVTYEEDNNSNEPWQMVTELVDFEPVIEKNTSEREIPSNQLVTVLDAKTWVEDSSDYSIDGEDKLIDIYKSKVPTVSTQKRTKKPRGTYDTKQKHLVNIESLNVESAVTPSLDPDATHKTNLSDIHEDLQKEIFKVVNDIDIGELLKEATNNDREKPKEGLDKNFENELLSMLYITDNESNKEEGDFDSLEKLDVKSALSNAFMEIADHPFKSNETIDDNRTVSLPKTILYELLADAVIAKTQNKTF